MCEKVKNIIKLINISKTIKLYKDKNIYQIIRNGSFNAILEENDNQIIVYNKDNLETRNVDNCLMLARNDFYNLFKKIFQEKIIQNTINTRKEIGVRNTIYKLEKNKWKIAIICSVLLSILLILSIKKTQQTLIVIVYIGIVLLTATITAKLIILLKAILSKDDSGDKHETLKCSQINKKYTILIPLYKEHHLVPQIVENINNIQYPKHLLDVKIILEEDDEKTIKVARELIKEDYFHIIIVPHYQPKTKPKALNYAAHFIEGDYVVIYDAEDMPDADQLLKMATVFENDKNCDIAQGILTFYNKFDNGLTVCFDIEYYQWFKYFIKGLYMYGIQIPLGGTTNHFRYEFLRKINFWDAYNVTEDLEIS